MKYKEWYIGSVKVCPILAVANSTHIREEYKNQGIYMILPILESGRSVKLEV